MNLLSAMGLGQKAIAGIVIATLAIGATVGAFASQDMLPFDGATDLFQTDETPTAEPTEAPDATETPEPADTPESEELEATETPDTDDDEVHGIPDDNPSHDAEDGDDDCEPGETVVKTTPSGEQVNVPCQTEKHDDCDDEGEGAEASETPGHGHAYGRDCGHGLGHDDHADDDDDDDEDEDDEEDDDDDDNGDDEE